MYQVFCTVIYRLCGADSQELEILFHSERFVNMGVRKFSISNVIIVNSYGNTCFLSKIQSGIAE